MKKRYVKTNLKTLDKDKKKIVLKILKYRPEYKYHFNLDKFNINELEFHLSKLKGGKK